MRIPRKLKKIYKKYRIPYSVTVKDINKYIDRHNHLDILYPEQLNLSVISNLI